MPSVADGSATNTELVRSPSLPKLRFDVTGDVSPAATTRYPLSGDAGTVIVSHTPSSPSRGSPSASLVRPA